jgi:hypothetical protein
MFRTAAGYDELLGHADDKTGLEGLLLWLWNHGRVLQRCDPEIGKA